MYLVLFSFAFSYRFYETFNLFFSLSHFEKIRSFLLPAFLCCFVSFRVFSVLSYVFSFFSFHYPLFFSVTFVSPTLFYSIYFPSFIIIFLMYYTLYCFFFLFGRLSLSFAFTVFFSLFHLFSFVFLPSSISHSFFHPLFCPILQNNPSTPRPAFYPLGLHCTPASNHHTMLHALLVESMSVVLSCARFSRLEKSVFDHEFQLGYWLIRRLCNYCWSCFVCSLYSLCICNSRSHTFNLQLTKKTGAKMDPIFSHFSRLNF